MASLIYESNQSNFQNVHAKAQAPTETIICETADIFRDIAVVKSLNKAKFPVYLVNSKVNKQDYAMKVFNYSGKVPHAYFENEARFSFLNHPNIIKTHFIEPERETVSKGVTKKVSYTVMEFAPHGDFFDLVMNHGKVFDEKLIRFYFKQLIDGIEYLHQSGVSHMDLKLENLLVGKGFGMKIADFDLSFINGDARILSRGTKFYRPPEVIQNRCKNTQAADIYAAGIILFTLKTKGMLPHAEDSKVGGVDFAGLLYTYNNEFWSKHCEIQKKEKSFFEQDFKDLFNAMVSLNPEDRASIDQIRQSKWYNGPCYTAEEVNFVVGKAFGK